MFYKLISLVLPFEKALRLRVIIGLFKLKSFFIPEILVFKGNLFLKILSPDLSSFY